MAGYGPDMRHQISPVSDEVCDHSLVVACYRLGQALSLEALLDSSDLHLIAYLECLVDSRILFHCEALHFAPGHY